MRRAILSVVLNIAEGSNRFTDRKTRQFINRSIGSLDETFAGVDCALNDGYISQDLYQKIMLMAEGLAKRLNAFSNYLIQKK